MAVLVRKGMAMFTGTPDKAGLKDAQTPIGVLIAYAAPAIPLYALLLAVGFLPYFYKLYLGMGFGISAAIVLSTRLWDVVTDPVIGILSDRTRLPWGRRKPWLLLGLPLVISGASLVFFAEPGVSPLRIGVSTMILFTGWTMLVLPLNAWSVEISGNYYERARISAARELGSLIGILAALFILSRGASGAPEAIGNAFRLLGIGILATAPICVIATILFVPDRPMAKGRLKTSWYDLKDLARNRPLKQLSLAFLINGTANGLPPILFLYYVGSILDAPGDAGLFILIYFACGILGVPIWTLLARRYGKHRTWMLSMGFATLFFTPCAFLGPGDWWTYLILVVLTGLCLGADFFLPPAIAADIVDQDELYSGEARAGLFFSLLSMIYKLSWALAGAGGLLALELSGFDEILGPQNSTAALVTLSVLYALAPALFKAGAILVMRSFELDAEQHGTLRSQIEAKRKA